MSNIGVGDMIYLLWYIEDAKEPVHSAAIVTKKTWDGETIIFEVRKRKWDKDSPEVKFETKTYYITPYNQE